MQNNTKIIRALWDKHAGHNDILHGDYTRNMTSWEFVKLQIDLDKNYLLVPREKINELSNDTELGAYIRLNGSITQE